MRVHWVAQSDGVRDEGLNGEAGVLLEGPSSAAEFADVRAHISEAARQSVEYDRSMKDAYNWWAVEFLAGLKTHVDDRPKDARGSPTIVVLAELVGSVTPRAGEVIYFEIPDAITAMRMHVHVFLFDDLPDTSESALDNRTSATSAYRGVVVGLEDGRGGVELRADWEVEARGGTSRLVDTDDGSVRPRPRDRMQQVRVELRDVLDEALVYVRVPPRRSWFPVLEEEDAKIETEFNDSDEVEIPNVMRGEVRWQRVIGLGEAGGRRASRYREAVLEMSPESGSYVLMLRRVKSAD